MYISPDLFEFRTDQDVAIPYSRTEENRKHVLGVSVLGKRRRNDGCRGSRDAPSSPFRKIKPPLTPINTGSIFHGTAETSLPSPPPDHNNFRLELNAGEAKRYLSVREDDSAPPSKLQRRVIPLKRNRVTETQDIGTSLVGSQSTLKPCHICHKAPRLKKDLAAYEDCWRCHERTCFICIRQCEARCGERKICRQCCVEEGENGDVSCLDCLQSSQDQEMEG